MSRKTNFRGFPTPAHHSRMGRQTTAFIRFPVESDAPKVPMMPVYTTVPVAGRDSEEFYWHQPQDLVSPSIPNTWSRSSLDSSSNPVNKTRKPLHTTSLPLLDTGWGHHEQIPPADSVPATEFDLGHSRWVDNRGKASCETSSRLTDGYHLSFAKEGRREPVVSGWREDQAFQPPMIEDQSALGMCTFF